MENSVRVRVREEVVVRRARRGGRGTEEDGKLGRRDIVSTISEIF